MAEFIRICEWAKYQHYKDRNPPWIKLYREIISSRFWVQCDDASRVLAVASMVLASTTDNKIPASADYVRRVAYLNQDPDYRKLVELQFVEIIDDSGKVLNLASTMLATCKQSVQNAIPETETETEKKNTSSKKIKNPSSRSRSPVSDIFSKAYECYPRHLGRGAASKSWDKAIARRKNGSTVEQTEDFLFNRVMTYAAACKRASTEPKFIPHMATWLNGDRFLDDPKEWDLRPGSGPVAKSVTSNKAADDELRRQGVIV